MKKLLLLGLIIAGGFIWFNNQHQKTIIPQFTDAENQMICIEEGI